MRIGISGIGVAGPYRPRGEVERAFSEYEAKLRPFARAKQNAAVQFRGFFAPKSQLALTVRNVVVKSLSIPVLGKRLLWRSVRDDFTLPDCLGLENFKT